jgi:hypothetical protein
MKPCAQCLKAFVPARRDARFCGFRCRKAHSRGKRPVPLDFEDAEVVLATVVLRWKSGDRTGAQAELNHYNAARRQAIAMMSTKVPSPAPDHPPSTGGEGVPAASSTG